MEKIGEDWGETHKSSEEIYISRRRKFSSNFIKRAQLHFDILGEGRNMRKEARQRERLSFVSYRNLHHYRWGLPLWDILDP